MDIWKGYNICNKLDKNLSSKCFEAQQLVRINESFWPIKMVAFDQLLVSSLPLSQLSESSFLIGKLRFGWSFDSTYWPLFLMLLQFSMLRFSLLCTSLVYPIGNQPIGTIGTSAPPITRKYSSLEGSRNNIWYLQEVSYFKSKRMSSIYRGPI